MIQVIQAQNVTLAYLKKKFALSKSEDEQFFPEWFDYMPEISELEKQYLDSSNFKLTKFGGKSSLRRQNELNT